GAWYGGHLVFGIGYAVNREAFLDGPTDWAPAGRAADVPADGMRVVEAGGMQVLMTRVDGRICALSAICSHEGGPLHEGTLENGVVTCPWHGSRFRGRDRRALSGHATLDLPRLGGGAPRHIRRAPAGGAGHRRRARSEAGNAASLSPGASDTVHGAWPDA